MAEVLPKKKPPIRVASLFNRDAWETIIVTVDRKALEESCFQDLMQKFRFCQQFYQLGHLEQLGRLQRP